MKKNLILYILLVFLVVVNGFFLFNYLGRPNMPPGGESAGNPERFIVKELNFNKTQIQEFDKLSEEHLKAMRDILDATKILKDKLLEEITDENAPNNEIDSIINLLSEQERKQESLRFYHLKAIQKICNEKQKQHFKTIINDVLHKGRMGDGPSESPPPRP
ncbi:Spy/CpxP family protein refolding chaperone [Yeosuana sp.]|uniref:Spy/CpxP family protein refolding chaperone n=1 Tax=Yeosuana sp. TaxID=2529388 RepID=UPI0040551F65